MKGECFYRIKGISLGRKGICRQNTRSVFSESRSSSSVENATLMLVLL